MQHLPGGGGNEVPPAAVPAVPDAVKRLFFSSDDSEKRETLMKYVHPDDAAARPVVEMSGVPGDDRTYPKRSNRARRGTAALVAWFCVLHDSGYTLDGGFEAKDFGVDQLGNLRGNKCLLEKISNTVTVETVSKNMACVAVMIETNIHSGLPLPQDLLHLLKILKSYIKYYSPLVMIHASHEEGDGKSALYMKLFNHLKEMKLTDPSAYTHVLQFLGQMPEVNSWLESAMQSIHLHAVLRFAPGVSNNTKNLEAVLAAFLSARVRYDGDIAGLLDFRRNGQAHLEGEYSVDQVGSLEAGLYGALEGIRIYQLQQQQKLQQQHHYQQQQQQQQHQQKQEQQLKGHQQQQQQEQEQLQQEHHVQLQQQKQEHQQLQEQQQQKQRWQELLQQRRWLEQQQRQERKSLQQRQERKQEQQREKLLERQQREREKLLEGQQQQREKLLEGQREQQQQLLQQALPIMRWPILAAAVTHFLSGNQLPLDAAKAGTAAAARYIANCAPAADQVTQSQQIQQAVSEGCLAAATIPPGGAAQVGPPASMFNANEINDMYDIISPNLLVEFQKVMFELGKGFRLGDDVKVPKLIP